MTKILLTRHGHVEGITPERFRGRNRWRSPSGGAWRRKRWRAVSPAAGSPSAFTRARWSAASKPARPSRAPAALPPARRATTSTTSITAAGSSRLSRMRRPTIPPSFAAWFETPQLVRFPGGELLQDLAARVADALRFVLARHTDGTIVIVGHDSVNRALLLQLLDLPLAAYWRFEQSPCCLNEIDVENGRVYVRRINETRHLDEAA